MREREPDHRTLRQRLKIKTNKPFRKHIKECNKKHYKPNTILKDALEEALDVDR